MSAKILGRITVVDQPRGPDVEYRIAVPEEWIEAGASLEIELPRNLTCVACGGGGCDACERSGAVSLRGRQEPGEIVEITLPKPQTDSNGGQSSRRIVVRVPERGGPSPKDSNLPRGHLLLSISAGPEPTRGVTRVGLMRKLSSIPEAARASLFGGRGRSVWVWLLVIAALLALVIARLVRG